MGSDQKLGVLNEEIVRMVYGRGEEIPVGVQREGARGEILRSSDGNRMEKTEPFSMSACSRHQTGGAVEERDQSKCPCSGMSPQAVSFSNPGLPCVELWYPT